MQGYMIESAGGNVSHLKIINNIFMASAPINIIDANNLVVVHNYFQPAVYPNGSTLAQYYAIQLKNTSAIIKNNVFYNFVKRPYIANTTNNFDSGYNLVYNENGRYNEGNYAYLSYYPTDLFNISPKITNLSYNQVIIENDSPLINNAVDISGVIIRNYDYFGNPILGSQDIGPFEYQNSSPSADKNGDGCIQESELISYIYEWKYGNVNIRSLIESNDLWINNFGCM